jgi:hypothetical protein
MSGVLRVGNASGFYGDRFTAWREMLDGGELDVLTGDYLAELTMLILGRDRLRDPSLGYARTFLRQLEGCLGTALGRGVRIVTNAGGLNPAGLAAAIGALAERLGLTVRVGHVEGDALPRRTPTWGRTASPPAWTAGPTWWSPAGSPTRPWWSGRPSPGSVGGATTSMRWPGRPSPATSSSAGRR